MDVGHRTENDSPAPDDLGSAEPVWDILEIITRSSADGITIQDATGTLIYANDTAGRMCGFGSGQEMRSAPPEAILSRFELLDEDGAPFPVERLPGRRAMAGEPEPEDIVRFRLRSGPEDRWALVRATPIFDDDGEVRFVVNVFMDVTKEQKRRREQKFITDVSRALWHSSLELETTLKHVAQVAVPSMADWCAVDVVEPDGSLGLIAIAHVDPAKVDRVYELRRRWPPKLDDASGVAKAIRTGRSELIPEVTQEMIDAAGISDPGLLEVIERLQPSSIMYVPLTARARTIGALTMVWAGSGNHYDEDDLRVAEDLASRVGLAIDNARLYEERDHVARTLQERLLPRSLPWIPELEVAARYLAAGNAMQAGGDFYDLFEMEDGSWKAVIGDVCGKGPEAAALMGFVRFTMRAVSRQDRKPSEALVKLNKALMEELDEGGSEFCTAAVVRIRPQDDGASLTVAIAGHPLPLIVRASGAIEEVGTPGALLGIFEDIDVTDVPVGFDAGDTLVMFTDGLSEASADPDWDTRIIPELLAGCAGLPPDVVVDRIEGAIAGLHERRMDDVAVLVIRCRDRTDQG